MIKTQMLLPTRDNEGRPFSASTWRELQARLAALGGYSRESGVFGGWKDDRGNVVTDHSRRYTVALDGWRQLAAWLGVVDWAKQAFRQDAIYIEVAGIPETITGPR